MSSDGLAAKLNRDPPTDQATASGHGGELQSSEVSSATALADTQNANTAAAMTATSPGTVSDASAMSEITARPLR